MFLIEGCLDVEFAFSCHSIILTELRAGSLLKMLKTVQAGGACVFLKHIQASKSRTCPNAASADIHGRNKRGECRKKNSGSLGPLSTVTQSP